MIKIIATDMDHTLLDDDSVLPKEFSTLIDELAEKNIEFVCASGRTLVSLHKKVKKDKDRISFVSDNGSVVEHHGEIVYKSTLSKEAWHQMVHAGRECPETSIIATGIDQAYIETHNEEHRKMLLEYYPGFNHYDNLLDLDIEVIKITFLSFDHTLDNYNTIIEPNFGKEFNTVRAGHTWIDIMNKDVNKGNGLKILLDRFNFSSDNLMSFGDFHNDIEMLELAAYSYAVANAHPDVKNVANEIIDSNNDNAVIRKIRELVLDK